MRNFQHQSSDEALEPQPVSNLDPTYHTLPKTKHTCELAAEAQVQAGEFHALEHLDVAWESGGEGKTWGEMKKVPGKVPNKGEGLRQHPLPISTPPA